MEHIVKYHIVAICYLIFSIGMLVSCIWEPDFSNRIWWGISAAFGGANAFISYLTSKMHKEDLGLYL